MKTFLIISFALIIALLVFDTCVTLKTPGLGLIAEVTAQNVGYEIAKENPTEVKQLLDETKEFLSILTEANSVTVYNDWAKMVLALTVKDPLLRMNFEKLLSLVQVDLKDKLVTDCFATVQQVLNDFLTGVSMGMKP